MNHAVVIVAVSALLAFLPQTAQGSDPAIAYVSSAGGATVIEVMDEDGSNPTEVFRGEKFYSWGVQPSWSPDGKSLTFEDGGLYRIDVDQLTAWPDEGTLLDEGNGDCGDLGYLWFGGAPEWSPSLTRSEIAVMLEDYALCAIDLDGVSREVIYASPFPNSFRGTFSWNSDGSKIAAFEDNGIDMAELIIIDRADGSVGPIFSWDALSVPDNWGWGDPDWGWGGPDWARRGDPRIAFSAGTIGRDTWIYTIDIDTGGVERIAKGYGASWSPDNTQIVFNTSQQHLKRYTFATGELVTLGSGHRPDWRHSAPTATCTLNADCDDGNPCTVNSCIGEVCVSDDNTADCDDGNVCTDPDQCEGGSCVGKPLDNEPALDDGICDGLCCAGECWVDAVSCDLDCSQFDGGKKLCNAELACRWDNRNKICVNG